MQLARLTTTTSSVVVINVVADVVVVAEEGASDDDNEVGEDWCWCEWDEFMVRVVERPRATPRHGFFAFFLEDAHGNGEM